MGQNILNLGEIMWNWIKSLFVVKRCLNCACRGDGTFNPDCLECLHSGKTYSGWKYKDWGSLLLSGVGNDGMD